MLSYKAIWKKRLDLAVGLLIMSILAPVMGLIAILVWTTLGRPVFFIQERPGLEGRPFRVRKFRTMTESRDIAGRLLPDATRLTAFGRFLRSTSLDELPELINVIRGDMSLVGPRPLLMPYLDRYNAHQCRRHEVRPGITGLTQVCGRNALSWEQKFAYDVWYVDHLSLRLDLAILGRTIWKIMTREGINQPGQATMEEFRGSGHRID